MLVVYFGTYTSEASTSRGIYRAALNLTTGALTAAQLAAQTTDPSYVVIARDGRHLYAVNEGKDAASVEAFAIDPATHDLKRLNQVSSEGGAPCHLTLDRTGNALVVANYVGGNVVSFPLRADGALGPRASLMQHKGSGPDADRQQAPHAHAAVIDPSGRRVFVCDLGTDRVVAYVIDGSGTLTPDPAAGGTVAPGSGPRHIAFHPQGRFAYVNNEMSATVTGFAYDAATGALSELQTISTLPEGYSGKKSTAQVLLTPDGRWLYVSNRGHDSIAIFGVDSSTGRLAIVGHQPTGGRTPRDFAIDPTGAFLVVANQDSDNVLVLRIDPASGRLNAVGAAQPVPRPVCVAFLPR